MNSSSQKLASTIMVMVGVIIVAGIGVDWWDARRVREELPPVTPPPSDVIMKRLVEENEKLKTENALLTMQKDALRKQLDGLNQTPPALDKPAVVKGEKPENE